jgi:hypothetical protein
MFFGGSSLGVDTRIEPLLSEQRQRCELRYASLSFIDILTLCISLSMSAMNANLSAKNAKSGHIAGLKLLRQWMRSCETPSRSLITTARAANAVPTSKHYESGSYGLQRL